MQLNTFATRFLTSPITWKLTIVSAIGIIAAVSTTSWLSFERSKELLLSAAMEHMRTAYMQQETKISDQIALIQRDTLLISKSEAVHNIVHTELNTQNETHPNEDWKKNLQNIFSETIKLTGYLQIRLIRLKDGKEIVRVDRNQTRNASPIVKSGDELQIKIDSDYVKQGSKLLKNEVYISPINLNREHGAIAQPHQPTQRFVTPVYSSQDKINAYGIIIINTDASYVNQDYTSKNDLIESIITNSTGGIIYHKDYNHRWGFEYNTGDHIKDTHPEIWKAITNTTAPAIVWEDKMMDVHIGGKISLSNTNENHFIALILTVASKDIFASIIALAIKTSLIALAAIIFVSFITILIVKRSTQPINTLMEEVSNITSGQNTIITIHNNDDEIGRLGNAFSTLIQKLQNHTTEAEEKRAEIQQLNATLEDKVEKRTSDLANRQIQLIKEVKTRIAINDTLQLSTSANSSESLANNALNALTKLDFLSIEKKGIFFLADKDGTSFNVVAVENINLEPGDLNAPIPIDHHILDSDYETRKSYLSTTLNEGFLTEKNRLQNHCHILIKSPTSILGIICLYLSPDAQEKPEETKFFEAVADILANAITRLTIEEKLHLSINKTNQALLKQKQISKELAIASQAANAANQAKSDFLSSMSHEIRTPMNGILGMAELLLETSPTQEQQEYLKVINTSGLALLEIINEILDFSKIEAGKLQIKMNTFNLSQIIQNAVLTISPKAQKKEIKLIIDYAENSPETFIGDASRIRQILLNLLGNALKFTHKGHITLKTSLLQEKNNCYKIHIAIIDTGIGIHPEAQATLFQAFTQADNSATRKYGGTGLGLAICKQLTELMDGEIGMESIPGEGSTFWVEFTLPAAKPEQPIPHESLNLKSKNMNLTQHFKSPTNTANSIDYSKLDTMRELLDDDFESLIHAFLNSATSIIESLPTAIANQDIQAAERLTHSLKSASANVGATTLSAMACDAENIIRDQGINNAKSFISQIESEYKLVCIELEKQL